MGEARSYPYQYLSLPDFIILVLKYKFLIGSIVLSAVVTGYVYLTISGLQATKAKPASVAQYYSECAVTFDPDRNIWGYLTLDRDLAQNIAAAYGLSQLRYMSWDEKSRKWIVEQFYTRDKNGRLRAGTTPGSINHENEAIPTLSFKFSREFSKISFSCSDAALPQRILMHYLDSLTEYYRRRDLEILNAKIRMKHRLLRGFRERIVIEKVSEQLASQMETAADIEAARFYPFTVVNLPAPPEKRDEPNTNAQKNPGKTRLTLNLLLIGAAAFLLSIFLAFLAESIAKMKTLNPDKFETIREYLHFRTHPKRG